MVAGELQSGQFVMVKGLVSRSDLNHRAGRVLHKSWTEAAQHPGRVPVEMVVGKEPMWVKLDNLVGPILDPADMTAPPYDAMTPEERTEASLQMLKPPAPAPAPAPAPPPAAAAIPSSDHENPWDFSDSEDEPAPAPAADRRAAARATLRNMMEEHCPRPHYCIYCGSEGLYGDKCVPCGFYRGSHCFGPNGPLQKGDTLMGRKLAYVKWPWQGDPEAPYVRAEVSAPAPELSAFGNPKPERKGDPWGVAAFFEQLLKELPYYHREEMAEILKGETIKDFRVGEVIDGRNSYEKSLTVSLTKTPCEDSDDESEGDADQASVPAERATRTITLNTYITPYDDNNAGVWLVDDTGYEHELCGVGTIPCTGGEPVRSFNKARAYQCAQYVVAYLVHGRLWWKEY